MKLTNLKRIECTYHTIDQFDKELGYSDNMPDGFITFIDIANRYNHLNNILKLCNFNIEHKDAEGFNILLDVTRLTQIRNLLIIIATSAQSLNEICEDMKQDGLDISIKTISDTTYTMTGFQEEYLDDIGMFIGIMLDGLELIGKFINHNKPSPAIEPVLNTDDPLTIKGNYNHDESCPQFKYKHNICNCGGDEVDDQLDDEENDCSISNDDGGESLSILHCHNADCEIYEDTKVGDKLHCSCGYNEQQQRVKPHNKEPRHALYCSTRKNNIQDTLPNIKVFICDCHVTDKSKIKV